MGPRLGARKWGPQDPAVTAPEMLQWGRAWGRGSGERPARRRPPVAVASMGPRLGARKWFLKSAGITALAKLQWGRAWGRGSGWSVVRALGG